MDDWRQKQSLADDPTFLASLEGLDQGLGVEADAKLPEAPPARSPGEQAPARRAQAPPQGIAPPPVDAPVERTATARAAAASAPPQRAPQPPVSAPAVSAAPRRRSVLDLFPPAGVVPAVPASTTAPPPSAPAEPPPRTVRHPEPARPPEPIAPPEPKPYLTFYSLDEEPFDSAPDPRFFFHSTSHDKAVQDLLTAIRRREGIVVVSGPAGGGRTILCRTVQEQLDYRTLTSFIVEPPGSIEELVATALADFGVVSRDDLAVRDRPASELVAALREFLLTLAPLHAFGVLFLDDAQRIPSAVLGELVTLADASSDERLLQIVLVGNGRLERKLRRRDLRPLARAVAVRCRVDALAPDEIGAYVMHRLAVAGPNPHVEFSDAAFARLHEITLGLPALINRICDRALEAGAASSSGVIDRPEVDAAATAAGIEPPERSIVRASKAAALVLTLAAMMAGGAVAAGYVFHDRVSSAITRWERIPPPPPRPAVAKSPALAPAAPPEM